jgi:hypothetical protein
MNLYVPNARDSSSENQQQNKKALSIITWGGNLSPHKAALVCIAGAIYATK